METPENNEQQTAAADPNMVTIQVGKRLTVVCKRLNGAEARKAGFMARMNDNIDNATCRAVYSIRKINAEVWPEPKNDGDIMRAMSRFDANELDAFMLFYQDATNDPDLEEQVKKLLDRKAPSSP